MKFTKMQGLGNDYLYVFGPPPADVQALSVRLSDGELACTVDRITEGSMGLGTDDV